MNRVSGYLFIIFYHLQLIVYVLCLATGHLLWLHLSDCLFLLGNYCPICFKCYEDNDYDSQMMQCGTCNHWVHAKCEDLTGIYLFIFYGFHILMLFKSVMHF